MEWPQRLIHIAFIGLTRSHYFDLLKILFAKTVPTNCQHTATFHLLLNKSQTKWIVLTGNSKYNTSNYHPSPQLLFCYCPNECILELKRRLADKTCKLTCTKNRENLLNH